MLPTFSWNVATDSDGDVVKYDLYFGKETDPATKIASDLGTATFTLTDRLSLTEQYYWKVVAKDGKGGETQSGTFGFTTRNLNIPDSPITPIADFSARSGHTTAVFKRKLWVIGGIEKDVWSSTDGSTWAQAIANADYPIRIGHTTAVFDDKLWVIGGLVF